MIGSILNYFSAGSQDLEEEVDLRETMEKIKGILEIKMREKSAEMNIPKGLR